MMLRLMLDWLVQWLSPVYWLRPWWARRFDPAERARLAAVRWLVAQHYAYGDDARFDKTAAEAERPLHGVAGDLSATAFLPSVLRANQLLNAGKHAAAAELYREVLKDQAQRYRKSGRYSNPEERRDMEFRETVLALLHCNLAAALAAGNGDAGEVDRNFRQAIDYQPNLTYLRQQWAEELVRRSAWDEADGAFEDVYRLAPSEDALQGRASNRAHLATARAEALQRDGKVDDAIGVLEQALGATGASSHKAWLGRMHYLLAQLCRTQQRHDPALIACRNSADFYRAAGDFSSASYLHEYRGDYLMQLRRDLEAAEAYDAGVAASEELKGETRRRHLRPQLLKIGALGLVTGDRARTAEPLAQWRQLAGIDFPWNPYSLLAQDAANVLSRADISSALKGYLDAELRNARSAQEARALVDGVRGLWGSTLWRQPPDEKQEGDPTLATLFNTMTPLIVEIELGALEDLGGGDAIIAKLSALRDGVRSAHGVTIPGTNVRDGVELGPGGYTISIHEVPRASGRVHPESKAFLGPAAAAASAGIGLLPFEHAPVLEGGWVARGDSAKATGAGLALVEPLDFLMRHLEETLIAHLVELVAHQEVQNLLESHEIVKPGESHRIVATEAARYMDPLTKVVRLLVSERVPVAEFKEIHRLFETRRAEGVLPGAIAEEARLLPMVRGRLWGNDGRHRLFRIGPRLEAELDRVTANAPGTALERKPQDGLLDAVRAAIQGVARPALVTGQQRHRQLARALVAHEFPDLPVLSLPELGGGRYRDIAGEIDVR